jgi:hypothetical protein
MAASGCAGSRSESDDVMKLEDMGELGYGRILKVLQYLDAVQSPATVANQVRSI